MLYIYAVKIRYLFIVLFITIVICLGSTSFDKIDPKNIIGTWQFVELLDNNGKHIDTLIDNEGFTIPIEADYTFKSDSTYSAKFSGENIDLGTWKYDSVENQVLLKLYLKKPYDEATLYIISLGYAEQDEKGDFYDLIPKKLIELSSEKLVILSKENHHIIYKRLTK